MPIVPVLPGYLPSSLNLAQATAAVADVISGASKPDILASATRAIQEALRWWDRDHPWSYLQETAPDQTLIVETATYALPGNLKHVYDVRLLTNDRTLYYVDRRAYNRIVWNQDATGIPNFYTLYQQGTALLIELLPTPSVVDTLSVRYHRMTSIPSANDDPIDVPEPWVDIILNRARALLLAGRAGSDTRRDFFIALSEQGMMKARTDDIVIADDDEGFVSYDTWANSAYPLTHAWASVQLSDGF